MEDTKLLKVFDKAELRVEADKREVLAIISTDSIDRDGEIVLPKGLKKKNYAGNSVVFYNHDYQNSLPIGKSLWVKEADGKLLAKTYISDKTQFARDVFALMQDGVLNAFSIGFISRSSSAPTEKEVKARPEWKGAKTIHREWELLEYSVVGIPSNPEALALAVSKGVSPDTIKFLSTENSLEEKEEVEAQVENKLDVAPAISDSDVQRAFYETLLRKLDRYGK